MVSTHSRPKAAGFFPEYWLSFMAVSTHSRPKAAGQTKGSNSSFFSVSTHSRPKAAGYEAVRAFIALHPVSTHSRPKAAGIGAMEYPFFSLFQHTAARRRLGLPKTNFTIH